MHYHVTRVDYDIRTERNRNPVELATVDSWDERNTAVAADERSAERGILRDYRTRECRSEGCRP